MQYKALAIDLDGTLLVGDTVPEANIRAVRAARDRGLKIIIATARWSQMARRVARTLGIDGSETFDVVGERTPGATLTLVIHRKDGERIEVPVTCRLDSDEDVEVYEAGGVLQRFAQDFLAANKTA